MSSNTKKSIIAGALVSSAGIFFSKLIGLLYSIPFNDILGSSVNVLYYGMTQTWYMYLLIVCQAGFPFAIASLVARYVSKGDYETSLYVKKISSRLMISLGFVMMLLLIIFSTPIAEMMISSEGEGNVTDFRWALVASSFALFFVPILSSLRGYYQGLKEMEIYSFSQVLEQLANATFVLVASSVAVYLFCKDHLWAVYFGVFSTSVAAITALIHLKLYDRKRMVQIRELAKKQEMKSSVSAKIIIKELLIVSIPFMLVALMGYSDSIINTFFLSKGLEAHKYSAHEVTVIASVITYSLVKLSSIPMVLGPGFSSAIIPHISSAMAENNTKTVKKNICECIDLVLYIAIPVAFCLFVFAEPLIVTLYPTKVAADIPLAADIVRWFSFVALLNTILPVINSILIATNMRRTSVRNIFIQTIIKFSLSFLSLKYFGYPGLAVSSMIALGTNVVLSIYEMTKVLHINWKYTFHKLIVIAAGCFVIWGVAQIMFMLGFDSKYEAGRMMALIQLLVAGGISALAYFIFTYIFQLPQVLLKLDFNKILAKIKR